MAGWLLAFTLSLDDLVIASFVAGPGSPTLPMVVYSSVRLGVSPQINTLATLIVAIITLCILLSGWRTGRNHNGCMRHRRLISPRDRSTRRVIRNSWLLEETPWS